MTRTRTFARGLGSLAVILAILIGVPAALWAFGGNPLPSSVPTVEEITSRLTRPDDGTLLVGALTWVGWIAWASLALSILLSAVAELRGMRAPTLPGLGWQQRRAAALTGAVAAMLTIAPAAATVGAANAAPAPATTPVAAASTTAPATAASTAPSAATASTDTPAAETPAPKAERVTVRAGDTLWEIADDELGDPTRYRDIADANNVPDPDVIVIGQKLLIPSQGSATTTAPPEKKAPATSSPASGDQKASSPGRDAGAGKDRDASTPTPSTGAAAADDTAGDAKGAAPAAPPSTASSPSANTPPSTAAPTTPATATASDTAQAADDDGSPAALITALGGVSLLGAAGALTLLRRRRDQQARRRQPGNRPATPPPNAAAVETALRSGQDPLAVEDLDAALRTLAALTTLDDGPERTPAVRAARITDDTLEVFLVDDDATLPAPFAPTADGVWVLHRDDRDRLLTADEAAAYPAPCPALVSIGVDEDGGLVMLNLEQLGALSISGDPTTTREVMTALAIELIGAQWADDARITLVGMLPDLIDAVASDRANYADDLDQVLAGLEYAARVHRAALTDDGLDDVTGARDTATHDEAWTPHLVLVDTPLTETQQQRITTLIQTLPRVAVAAVTHSPATQTPQVGEWVLHTRDLAGDVVADLAPIGLTLVPQRLAAAAYDDAIALYRAADEPDVPGPDWAATITDGSAPDLDTVPVVPTDLDDLDAVNELDAPAHDHTLETPTAEEAAAQAPVVDEHQDLVDDETTDNVDDTATAAEDDETAADEERSQEAEPLSAGQDVDEEDAAAADVDAEVAPESSAEIPDGDDSPANAEPVRAPVLVAALDGSRRRPGTVTIPVDTSRESDEDAPPAVDAPALVLPDGPLLRLLGADVALDGPLGKKPAAPGRSLEVLAYLALCPGRDETAFTEAIFPGKIYDPKVRQLRNNYLGFARRWVGEAPDGHPYVALVDDRGYRLAEDMPTDWGLFTGLVGDDIAAASTGDLVNAMRLVTDAPMSRVTAGRYAWATEPMREIRCSVADVAHELSHRAARAGSPRLALEAAMKGLWAEPLMEVLWRDKIAAIWAMGHPSRVAEVITECQDTLEEHGDLEPETLDLIRQITDRTTRPLAIA